MRDYIGTWKAKPPEPSPGPWGMREHQERNRFGNIEHSWVVLDVNGKCVAECERWEDADFIVRHGPQPAPVAPPPPPPAGKPEPR
jgi:hypothetical protein